ncbi:uncharacterized protein LOC131843397 [Achroia grisella]|uniref:uncharacterized protein LOC131843397 n=1 Tax=Achroia grisella TaxID=688607 RepID=UPI0027D309D6|nr:uncharacterized protein LOC131843397 [Achroia grisella]
MNIPLVVSILYIIVNLTGDVECFLEKKAQDSNIHITNGNAFAHRSKRELLGNSIMSRSASVQSRDPTIIVTPNGGVPSAYRGLPYSNVPYSNTVNRGPTVVILPEDSGISRGPYYGIPTTNVRI